MAEPLPPGDILSMTARAADRLMGAGTGTQRPLYLWLCAGADGWKAGGVCRALKWTPG